jgi:hypothetical protein
LEKHVDANHVTLTKRFENVKSPLRNVLERQIAKKRPNVSNFKLSKFFGVKDPFKKDVCNKSNFLQNLALLVIKNHLQVQFVNNTWLKCLVMHLFLRVVFPLRNMFSQEVLVDLVEKMIYKNMCCLN